MNFGEWVQIKISLLDISQNKFTDMVGTGGSSVRRWVQGHQPRIDLLIATCEVISNLTGDSLDDVIIEACRSTPAYMSANKRIERVAQ